MSLVDASALGVMRRQVFQRAHAPPRRFETKMLDIHESLKVIKPHQLEHCFIFVGSLFYF